MKKTALSLMLPVLMLTAACTSNIGADDYAVQNVNTVQSAQIGTIISVRKVIVRNENGGGALLGTVAGGVAGSQIGRGSTAGVLGGIAGDIAQDGLSKQAGYEYVIQLQNGGVVTVTQGNDVLMTVGEKCLVIYGPQARVIPYN